MNPGPELPKKSGWTPIPTKYPRISLPYEAAVGAARSQRGWESASREVMSNILQTFLRALADGERNPEYRNFADQIAAYDTEQGEA